MERLVENIGIVEDQIRKIEYILSRATFPGALSYGGVRTWVEAEASNLLGYKEYPIHTLNQY